MSAAIKAATVLGGLAAFSAGAVYTLRTPQSDFSKNALAAAEHGASEISEAVKPKLPSNFFQFSIGKYQIGNARA